MCGNFGLLLLRTSSSFNDDTVVRNVTVENDIAVPTSDDLRDSLSLTLHESLHEVSRLHGLRVSTDAGDKLQLDNSRDKAATNLQNNLLSPLLILESQTASTEIRGGQAGGYSCLEYESLSNKNLTISTKRVRLVARKRHALAADLASLYKKKGGEAPTSSATLSVIGHTRFATSSVNKVSGML